MAVAVGQVTGPGPIEQAQRAALAYARAARRSQGAEEAFQVPASAKGTQVRNDGAVYALYEDRDRLLGRVGIGERPRYDDLLRATEKARARLSAREAALDVSRRTEAAPSPSEQASEAVAAIAKRLGLEAQARPVRSARDLTGVLVDMAR